MPMYVAGIPLIAEGEFAVDTAAPNEWTWGAPHPASFTKKYAATFRVKAGPHETVHVVSTVNKGELEVPCTVRLSSKSSGAKAETKGVWRGVSSWDLCHTVSAQMGACDCYNGI